MTTKAKPNYLPPCRVCNGPGNGFHYGVSTCDGCKGFFHRGLTQHTQYKCRTQEKCIIQYGKGRLCRLCRFKKCLGVGMSKQAIKTGRYSSAKKAEVITEVKMLEREMTRDQDLKLQGSGTGGYGTNVAQMELSEGTLDKKYRTETTGKLGTEIVSFTTILAPHTKAHNPSSILLSSTSSDIPKSTQIYGPNPSPPYDNNQASSSIPNLAELHHPFSPCSMQTSPSELSPCGSLIFITASDSPEETEACRNEFCSRYSNDVQTQEDTDYIVDLFMDKGNILQLLMEAHEKALKDHFWTEEELLRVTHEYYDLCKSRLEAFGVLQRLDDDEYNCIYQDTGLDVDGRQESFHKFGDGVEKCIQRMIMFIKAVPGFLDLKLEDQTDLIKNNRLEFSFLCNYMFANIKLGVVACFSGHWNCLLEAKSPQKYEVSKAYIDLCARFQSFNLTEEERVILKAMSVMNPDRSILKNPNLVYQIHWNLTEIFLFHLRQRQENPHLMFAKIIDALSNFRNIEAGIKDCVKNWNINQFSQLQKRPLLHAMVSDFYIPSK